MIADAEEFAVKPELGTRTTFPISSELTRRLEVVRVPNLGVAIDVNCAFRYDSAVILDFGYVAWPASFA
jgi:hypothetical protein